MGLELPAKSMSQSQSQSQKRKPADFFKPYQRSVPAKRSSPNPESQDKHGRSPKKSKKVPNTPATATRFADFESSPVKSPFSLGRSPKLPIRSPRPKEQGTPSCSNAALLFSSPLSKQHSTAKEPTPFSFSDVPRTAQSVIKDGKVLAVRDSDEDDSESLESLEDIFCRTKGSNTSSSSPPDPDTKKENKRPNVSGLFSNRERQAIVGKDTLRDILAKQRLHKFDISKLIGDHLDDAETKEKLDKANAFYESSARQTDLETKQSHDDQKLLSEIIDAKGGDRDDMARVIGAMERTGALASEQSFSFFGQGGSTEWTEGSRPKHKFPKREYPHDIWHHEDTNEHWAAYVSQQVGVMGAKGELSDSLLKWTFESIALEPRDDIREAYIRCVADASAQWTRMNLTAREVQDVFQTLGADPDAIRDGVDIVRNRKRALSERQRDPKYLLSVLETFDAIADDLDFTALSKLSSVLSRLSLDDEAMEDGRISVAVEESISRLLELPNQKSRMHVAERILTDMGNNLKDSFLQARLLSHILPTSPLASRLQLLLAQIFLLQASVQPHHLLETPSISLPALLQHLRLPTFDVSHRHDDNRVNYTELASLTHIFGIAISDGGHPFEFNSKAVENAFNRQVDDLADRVNTIFSSIADTGASHIRRTEAKEALGVLHKRLLYSVRTRPRPKKSVFGGRDGAECRAEQRSKGAMQQFLKKKSVLQERAVNTTSYSQPSESEVLVRTQLGLN